MSKEILWFSLVPISLLSMIGGTWWKPARRYGVPLTLCLTLTLGGIVAYKAIMASILLSIGLHFPITVGKGDIRAWWQYAWVFLLGVLLAATALVVGGSWIAVLICGSLFGLLITISNLKLLPWKAFEFFGYAIIVVPCLFPVAN